jgi:hypothetical protein
MGPWMAYHLVQWFLSGGPPAAYNPTELPIRAAITFR